MESSPTTVPADRFVRSLIDTELISPTEAEQLSRQGRDSREMARELVKRQKITRFQAGMLLQGKTVVLDNYLVLEPLGEGGMGQVFKARHRGLKRIVALKILSPAFTRNETALKRFQREVRAAAKLNHPNIVAARDAGQANGVHFLVMECVTGSDLSRWVKANGPMPAPQAVDCIKQAARGLAHAHAAGIVHRDIKPSNLLLSQAHGAPSVGVVKVLDMGLARIDAGENAGNETACDELTKTGSIMGTSDYMAPEQAMNAKSADHRADVYSLGCTLFFLLTGKPAYQGETAMEKVFAHREQPIPHLPAGSRHLQPILCKMMAKRPEDRYASMTEVIAALESAGQPRRRRVLPLVLLGGGTVAAAVALLAFSLGGEAKAPTSPEPAVAGPTAPAIVRPTELVHVTPDKAILPDARKPVQAAPPGGFILNQKPAGTGRPMGKDPGFNWETIGPGVAGGPGGKPNQAAERTREVQKLEGQMDRLAEMQRLQAQKALENPPSPPKR